MNHTNILLDKFKLACSLKTDMALAARLGVTRGTVSSWRHEIRHAEPESVEAMAKACHLDADEWVLRVQADREGSVNPRRAQVWLRCAQRLAATAAIVVVSLMVNSHREDSKTYGRLDGFSQNQPTLYIMSNWIRRLRGLRKLVGVLITRLGKGMPHAISLAV